MVATTRDDGVPRRDTAESGGALLGVAGCGWGFELALRREGLEIVLSTSGDVSSNSSQDSSVALADFGSLAGLSAFSPGSVLACDP